MNPIVTALIKTFFTNKNGKPNKILEKMGPDVLSGLLQNTFKNEKPTQETLNLITALNSGKAKQTKEQKEAIKRLNDPEAYKKGKGSWVLQDIISPLVSNSVRTLGNVAAIQAQIPGQAQAAAAEAARQSIDPRVLQGSMAAQAFNSNLAGQIAASSLLGQAKGALRKGLLDASAGTLEHATAVARAEDEKVRLNQMINDKAVAYGEAPPAAYYDLLNRQAKNQQESAKQLAGGF